MRAISFWLAAAGGLLLAAASVLGSRLLAALGAILFLVGTASFFVLTDALRFAWHLMP